jgi:hypothetical protein
MTLNIEDFTEDCNGIAFWVEWKIEPILLIINNENLNFTENLEAKELLVICGQNL